MTMENPRELELKLGARRLPELKLASVPGGSPVPLRPPGRVSPVLILLDAADCGPCRAWLRRLAASAPDLAEWDGRVIVVLPASPGQAAAIADDATQPFTLLADPERTLTPRLGLSAPALVIADQYGEIHHAAEAGADHHLPDPAEMIDWLRYLAVQCPECQGEAL